jgi:hypothetical protein
MHRQKHRKSEGCRHQIQSIAIEIERQRVEQHSVPEDVETGPTTTTEEAEHMVVGRLHLECNTPEVEEVEKVEAAERGEEVEVEEVEDTVDRILRLKRILRLVLSNVRLRLDQVMQ